MTLPALAVVALVALVLVLGLAFLGTDGEP